MCDNCVWADALTEIGDIMDQIDDLPDQAQDFGGSVRETLQSIYDWIEENEHVTEAQEEAVDNISNGVSRWFD